MGQIQGSLQNVEIDVTGSGTSYKNLVCVSNSSVATTVDTSTDQTNCGVLTAPGQPSMAVDFDAVCEAEPTVSQVSYNSLLTAMNNKTLIGVKVISPSVGSLAIGEAYTHIFDGYITSLTLTQASGEFIKFSGSISSTGILDVTG
jgi:hypothetical protein